MFKMYDCSGNKVEKLTMDDLIKARDINDPIDNSKEEIKYDTNGNITYWYDGKDNWYHAWYDDHHNLLYYIHRSFFLLLLKLHLSCLD